MNSSSYKYKKQSFLKKLNNKILISSCKTQKKNAISQYPQNNTSHLNKKEFFNVYDSVKCQKINIESLDIDTVRKILLMTIEELNLNSKKIDQKLETLEIALDNSKIYNKEIEFNLRAKKSNT